MSQPQPVAPDPPVIAAHITLGKDGRRLSQQSRDAMEKGLAAGRKANAEAHALRRQTIQIREDPQDLEAKSKLFALALVPDILKRWGKGAMGRLKGWPASVQVECGKLILGVAGIALESKARGSGPLAEMSLQELELSLSSSLDSTRNLIALEAQASQVIESIESDSPVIGDSVPPEASEPVPGEPELPSAPAPDDAPT